MQSGCLFYIIGPSGAGKDSLIQYARQQAPMPNLLYAHRYITRPKDQGGENHVELDVTEFEHRLTRGLFAMHWRSHQLCYGVGIEIDRWLERGCHVLVNGSRAYLPTAAQKYPNLAPVLVQVSPERLRERLQNRARENDTDIQARLARALEYAEVHHERLRIVSNDGELAQAGQALVDIIQEETT